MSVSKKSGLEGIFLNMSRIAAMPAQNIRIDYSGTNITSAAYVQLTASVNAHMIMAEIVDTGGQDLKIAVGPAGGEVDFYYIPANQSKLIPFHVGVNTRLSVKSLGSTVSSGTLVINLFT